MNNYLVVKVLESQSISVPTTNIYSDVEIRSCKSDLEYEIEKLKESAELAKLDFEKYSFSCRISTIVQSENIKKAIIEAESKFIQVLDLKSVEIPLSNFSFSPIGFIKNLDTGDIEPIHKQDIEPCLSFMVHDGEIQKFDNVNYVLSINTDLSNRYLRSLHWLRHSKHEKNSQLRILFNWFAMEALLKESEKDNIGYIIRWFLGFPNGKATLDVSNKTRLSLESNLSYKRWKNKLVDIMEKIRIFRNDSVHSGFRTVDFSNEELDLYLQIMILGTARCQSAVAIALVNKISTVAEFKDYIPIIFEQNNNLINDVHNNVIYSLDNIKNT